MKDFRTTLFRFKTSRGTIICITTKEVVLSTTLNHDPKKSTETLTTSVHFTSVYIYREPKAYGRIDNLISLKKDSKHNWRLQVIVTLVRRLLHFW